MAVTKSQIKTARRAFADSKKTRDAAIYKSAKLWYRWQHLRKAAGLKNELALVAS